MTRALAFSGAQSSPPLSASAPNLHLAWDPDHRSESEWIGLRRAVRTLGRQGCHRMRLFEPDIGVELFRQDRFEIVAQVFGVGTVHDTDRALEQWLAQGGRRLSMRLPAPVCERSVQPRHAEGVFVGITSRWPHRFDLHG